jgi:hypothetical protein
MPQPIPDNIAITVIPQADGRYICEVTPSLKERTSPTKRIHGQNPKHAIAIALEQVARTLRMEVEAEQNIDWEAVDRSPTGQVNRKRFHVILHYERVAEEESKFEAMVNTQMGNAVVENAEISIIEIDPDLPIEPLAKWHRES